MLAPALQGEQHEQSDITGVQRTNEPSLHQSTTNGNVGAHQQSTDNASTAQDLNVQYAQPQHNIYWKYQQHESSSHQTDNRHYSFASSMDLISSTTASTVKANGNSYQTTQSQPLQNDLFKSSSHHTSHTAAAGDLLTMSRRALDPPTSNQMISFTKKRSAAMADANNNASQFNLKKCQVRSFSDTQGLDNVMNTLQQHMHAPPYCNPLEQKGAFFSNQSPLASSSVEWVASSMAHDLGGIDELHQEHRTIRRCRRSDSFEMMEDG